MARSCSMNFLSSRVSSCAKRRASSRLELKARASARTRVALGRARAIQDGGRPDGAMFGEGVGHVLAVLSWSPLLRSQIVTLEMSALRGLSSLSPTRAVVTHNTSKRRSKHPKYALQKMQEDEILFTCVSECALQLAVSLTMPARVDQYDAMGLLPSGKRGATSFVGPPNRFRELNRLERKRLRDEVDVAEVLPAAIGDAASDECLKLFSYGRLGREASRYGVGASRSAG
jgi:hypothetical protein